MSVVGAMYNDLRVPVDPCSCMPAPVSLSERLSVDPRLRRTGAFWVILYKE